MQNQRRITLLRLCLLLLAVAVIGGALYLWQRHRAAEPRAISFTSFIDLVDSGKIKKVNVAGDAITAVAADGKTFHLYRPLDAELSKILLGKHVDFAVRPAPEQTKWLELGFLAAALIAVFCVLRKFGGFGRSSLRVADASESSTRFSDVAGAEEAKHDLLETVDFLKDPGKFSRLGGKLPTGVLLVGPPGTGKTLIARAVAGEAEVPFFSLSASEFVEMYVGVGASRVRSLFAQAGKAAPCIVFIDEIDAIGRRRDGGGSGASDERDQTLNQLLVEMDGFGSNAGVVVIAATNRPEILDPALLRPGRFDRQVVVPSPDIRGREAILKVHTRQMPLHPEVELGIIARGTPGFSGADLANLVNEAAILAARSDKENVEMSDFDTAKDKVLMGAEKKSMVLSEQSKLSTAYHEAGHVLVAKLVPGCDPVHKVSIIPRGRALGVTVQIPEEDIHCYTRQMLISHIKVLMGGRAAEDLVYQTTTTGAGNDIARATDMARKMVSEWGMSEAFGPVAFGADESGSGAGQPKRYSEATALEIDAEIRGIVTTAYREVRDLLQTNMGALEQLTRELVARETLGAPEIDAIVAPALKAITPPQAA